MVIQSEKKKQLLKTESIKESESLVELVQPKIQPQEFLNRRYMTQVNHSRKQENEERPWRADYARKPNLLKCWNTLPESDGQEKKQESLESWESSVKSQEVSKPVVSFDQGNLWSTLQEEQKQQISMTPVSHWKPETSKSKVGTPQEEQNIQDTPKPWVVQPQKEQDPKKVPSGSWTVSVQSEQSSGRSWTTPVCGEGDSTKPRTSVSWEHSAENQKHSLAPQSQTPLKSWGEASADLLPNDQLLPRKLNVKPKDVPRSVPQPLDSSSPFPKDPLLRKEKLQDLMAQIQGTCNFMQESVLDLDKPSSAVPSPQPPSASPVSTVSAEQNVSNQSDFIQEPLRVASSVTCSSNACLATTDQASSGTETEFMTSETPEMTVPPSKPAPLLSKGFQLPPARGSSAVVSTVPFQAMQTVFNVNAPLPPREEQEVKECPYSPGYNQNFTSASTQTISQCQLPAIHIEQTAQPPDTAAGYHPDGTVQVSNGSLTFYPVPTSVFPRPAQPSIRGCTRGGRLLMNPCWPSCGYKGFDSCRGPPSASNGNYSQLQLQATEYPGIPCTQGDNFQQCYNRSGISDGLQANSRGWSDSSQVSSPERDRETFNSGDSGQGDSRSMTPVDVPVTSPAAAIFPIHVYPLPQQMRVAFSAARTSNLAPGTLDQPIVFDLLLNNLGETFDLQLGRFNCPVNGTYVFIFHMLKLAVNVPLYVNLMKNEEVLVSAYANDGAPDHETASNHAILQLLQGDQIWLRLHRGAIYGSSWKYSTFSGYLLYQD
ncbi:caprin-2 isoform X8 [Chionomys nivalis]|nr:caprin-2 isoform X8 [Chionomys nivalis]